MLSYNVQWDAGLNAGDFYELVGYSVPYLQLEYTILNDIQGLTPGMSYKFRYRAQNKYGWGEYSDSASFLAAAIPLQSDSVTT